MSYSAALSRLSPPDQSLVSDAFLGWASDAKWKRITENALQETALQESDYLEFLQSFANFLNGGNSEQEAWKKACWDNQCKGAQLPTDACPVLLGRAVGLKDYARLIQKGSQGTVVAEEARKVLRRREFGTRGHPIESWIKEARLSEHLVWATYNPDDDTTCPFERLPRDAASVCTALGLGDSIDPSGSASDAICLLTWNHLDSGSPSLHRPTVADAADYPHYRPVPDPNARCGQTEPCSPNHGGLAGQPELVLESITGVGLVFAYTVA